LFSFAIKQIKNIAKEETINIILMIKKKKERRSARVKPCPLFNILFHLEIRHSTGEKSFATSGSRGL